MDALISPPLSPNESNRRASPKKVSPQKPSLVLFDDNGPSKLSKLDRFNSSQLYVKASSGSPTNDDLTRIQNSNAQNGGVENDVQACYSLPQEEYIQVHVYFYTEDENLQAQLFTEPFYDIIDEESQFSPVDRQCPPPITFEVAERCTTIDHMLEQAISEVNQILNETDSKFKFTCDTTLGEEVYDVYMAKKRNGKPKQDYPNFEPQMLVQNANVKQNRFSVLFTEQAIIEVPHQEPQRLQNSNQQEKDFKEIKTQELSTDLKLDNKLEKLNEGSPVKQEEQNIFKDRTNIDQMKVTSSVVKSFASCSRSTGVSNTTGYRKSSKKEKRKPVPPEDNTACCKLGTFRSFECSIF